MASSSSPSPSSQAPDSFCTDRNAIIGYAKSYGASKGMTWDDSLTIDNCSWEMPLHQSSYSTADAMKSAIRGRIDRVKNIQVNGGEVAGQFYFKLTLSSDGLMYFLIG